MITFSTYYWEAFVKKYSRLLDWNELSRNPNISFEIFWEHLEKYPWNYKMMLSWNKNVTVDHVLRNPLPHKDWCIKNTITNPNVTLDFVLKTPEFEWDVHDYLMNPNACVEEILEKAPWIINSMNVFFLHPNAQIKPSTLLSFPDYHWNWKHISQSSCIHFDFIKDHPELSWNMSALSENPNVTIDHILGNPDWKWDFCKFTQNVNVNKNIILKYPNMKWTFSNLLHNPNLTRDDILMICHRVEPFQYWVKTSYHIFCSLYESCRIDHGNLMFHDIDRYYVRLMPTECSKYEFKYERKRFENNLSRCKEFVDRIEEELISKVYHPRRLSLFIEKYGYHEAIEMWND